MKRYNSPTSSQHLIKDEKICRYLLEMTRSKIKSLLKQMMNVFTSTVMGSSGSTGVEVGYILHPSAISFARQMGPRVQSEYSVDYLGTKVVADILYGGVAVFEPRIYEFKNP